MLMLFFSAWLYTYFSAFKYSTLLTMGMAIGGNENRDVEIGNRHEELDWE